MCKSEQATVKSIIEWFEQVLREHGDLPLFLHDDYGESEVTANLFQVAPPKSPFLSPDIQAKIESGNEPAWVKLNTYPTRIRIMAKT